MTTTHDDRSIDVGRFTLTEHRPPDGKVTITHNATSAVSGEGGTFPAAGLEAAIATFYQEHF